jgi:nitroreductase
MNNIDFLNLVKKRTSVRDFSSQPIEKEKLDYIMEAVRLAPSAVNYQPWQFYIVKNKEKVIKLSEAYNRDWFRTAPACIVACGNHTQSWHRKDGKDHCDIDLAIAITHLTMAATEQNLGTCWVCNFHADICKEIMNLPTDLEPIALIPIGYPVNEEIFQNNEKKRKSVDEIFSYWD